MYEKDHPPTKKSENIIKITPDIFNDLCVKLRHKYENTFYYIRSCADQFKNILIKKTEVCYSTRKKDGSYLCFCGHDRCNSQNRIRANYRVQIQFSIYLQLILKLLWFWVCFFNRNCTFFHFFLIIKKCNKKLSLY